MPIVNKHVLVEYSLAVKMGDDMVGNTYTKINYEPLCDCDIIFGLIYVLPMLKAVQSLSKLIQDIDNFVGGSIHNWGTKKESLFLFILHYYNCSGLLYGNR
jgi:hypothetical protein